MKINIENGESRIELVTPNQLSTGEMVGIFELVGAGKRTVRTAPERPETSISVKSPTPIAGTLTGEHQPVSSKPTSSRHYYEYNDMVKILFSCKYCGYTGTRMEAYGHQYATCPFCKKKLRLDNAGENRYTPDNRGYFRKAIMLYEEPTDKTANPVVKAPDVYSTVDEMKRYLDLKQVDYSKARMKSDYIRLVKEAKD